MASIDEVEDQVRRLRAQVAAIALILTDLIHAHGPRAETRLAKSAAELAKVVEELTGTKIDWNLTPIRN